MSETKFVDGFSAFQPHEKAPDFVKADLSIDLKKFFVWAKQWKEENPDEDYLKIQVKESRGGKYYAALNDFKKTAPKAEAQPKTEAQPDFDDDIPF